MKKVSNNNNSSKKRREGSLSFPFFEIFSRERGRDPVEDICLVESGSGARDRVTGRWLVDVA